MPGSSPPSRTASERLERIDQAALRLFAQRGYAATTVDDIVRAAGLTKPMLYRHYESKQELCIALLERSREDLIGAALHELAPGERDPRAQLVSMIEAWLRQVERNPEAARLVFTPITGDPQVEQVQRDIETRQRATHAGLLRGFAPDLSEVDAEPLGEVIRVSFGAMALWWLDHPEHAAEVPARALLAVTVGILTTLHAPGTGAEVREGGRRADAE